MKLVPELETPAPLAAVTEPLWVVEADVKVYAPTVFDQPAPPNVGYV